MSTANRRNKRRQLEEEQLDEQLDQEIEQEVEEKMAVARTKRGFLRSLRFWAVTLSLLVLVLWLAPTIVARTPLLNQVLASTLSDLPGSFTAQSASLGWFSPIVLTDVQLRDDEDELLLRAEGVRGDVALWNLLLNPQSPGRFRVLRPELRLTVEGQETNIERLIKSLEDRPASLDCPALEVELVDGVLAIEDMVTDRHWQIDDVQALLTLARDWSEPMQLKVSATLPQADRKTALDLEMKLARSLDKMERISQQGELKLKCGGFPLVVAEPLLRRRWRSLELDGWLTSDAGVTWQACDTGIDQLAVQGEIGAEQLRLSGPLVGADELRLERLQAPLKIQLDGQQLTIDSLKLDCDVGQSQLVGPVRLQLDPENRTQLTQALMSETYQFTGDADLAKLAALLPETIRLREGTEITAGRLTWELSSHRDQQQPLWQGKLETSNLVGQTGQRRWTWQKPMYVNFAAHQAAQGFVIDKLDCQSKFLQMEAAGQLDKLSAWATFDLNLLADELGQFIDLKQIDLAGDGWTYVDWARQQDGRFQANGEFQVRQFRLAAPDRRTWSEENLLVFFKLVGLADDSRLQRVDNADIKLESKPDALTLELVKPLSDFNSKATWPLEFKLVGDLATWQPRLAPWISGLQDWDLDGSIELTGSVEASSDRIDIQQAECHCKPLRVAGPKLRIDEPQADLLIKGRFDQATRQAKFASLQLESEGLSLDAREVQLHWPIDEPWHASGTASIKGELAAWQRWTADPRQPSLWRWSGRAQGDLKLVSGANNSINAQIDAEVLNLTAECPDREPWREPNLQFVGTLRYLRDKDSLVIDSVSATSQALNCKVEGEIAALRGRRDLTLSGQYDYEPQKLLDLLQPYLGDGVEVTAAREARPFSVQGPLAALAVGNNQAPVEMVDQLYRQFTAEATTGWIGANVHGFRVGSGEIRGRLVDGMLNIDPLNLAVSEGRLTATPRIRLWPEPAELQVDSGPLLTKIRISPQMCDAGLKYIAPVLAGVTQAQGEFSMSLNGCSIPLDHPDRGEMAGEFTVHAVDIGPGPLIKELAVLLERPGVAKLSRESVVPFRLVDGRVYHRDLELVFPEITIRTHGSVGLDKTLAIMAEMPVPPKWISGNSLGTALKNQTIKLPIGGTLNEPRIDPKALAQASGEFLRTGARNLLFDELNRGLNRLLKPPEE